MTGLLENDLVQKYFGDELKFEEDGLLAWRVIQAMQQPIKAGERYLSVWRDWSVHEESGLGSGGKRFVIRLPDRFQKKECCDQYFSGSCPTCHSVHSCPPKPEPDEVEEKILEIRDLYAKEKLDDHGPVVRVIHEKLAELVSLAEKRAREAK